MLMELEPGQILRGLLLTRSGPIRDSRIKIARNAAWPDIELSRQVLLNCLDERGRGSEMSSCNGGDPYAAYDYIAKRSIPDETCAAYVAGDQVNRPAPHGWLISR